MDAGGEAGPSYVRFESPDISRWTFVGDISESEMRRLRAEQQAYLAGKPYVLMLVDLSRTGAVSPGARKAGAEAPDLPVFGTAIFGASFHLRVIANVVTTAGGLLRKATDSPVQFFASEQAALAWLVGRRVIAEGRFTSAVR